MVSAALPSGSHAVASPASASRRVPLTMLRLVRCRRCLQHGILLTGLSFLYTSFQCDSTASEGVTKGPCLTLLTWRSSPASYTQGQSKATAYGCTTRRVSMLSMTTDTQFDILRSIMNYEPPNLDSQLDCLSQCRSRNTPTIHPAERASSLQLALASAKPINCET